MKLMPIVYVAQMSRSLDFYLALGLEPDYVEREGVWSSLKSGDAVLGLHTLDPLPPTQEVGRVALALVSAEALEALVARLAEQGIAPARAIRSEPFGRSLLLRDPDGLLIQVNEHAH